VDGSLEGGARVNRISARPSSLVLRTSSNGP
jgi:hypothetical protein